MGVDHVMLRANSAPSTNTDQNFLRSLGWASPQLIDAVLADLPPNSLPDDSRERKCWLLYALLQRTADANHLDSLAWANEERINDYLDIIAGGKLPDDLLAMRVWLKYLPGNRAQKHSRQRRLLVRFRNDLHRVGLVVPSDPAPPDADAEEADDLAQVRRRASEREWRLLCRAAAEDLEGIAESENLPNGTLKSLLSRCRARLRQVC
jgi:hypothetical protein